MSYPFVVVFMARSGSTALYGNLRQVPGVKMGGEVFGSKLLHGFGEQTDDNRIAFLRKFWSQFKDGPRGSNILHRGFKLQINAGKTQFGNPARLARIMAEFNPKVIVLRRQNILKQAISSVNARRVETLRVEENLAPSCHITQENGNLVDKLKAEKLLLDIHRLRRTLNGIRRGQKRLNRFAEKFENRLEVFYEDYLADRNRVLAAIFAYLELAADPAAIADTYVKITDDDLSKSVENYDALRRFVSGSEYEKMI